MEDLDGIRTAFEGLVKQAQKRRLVTYDDVTAFLANDTSARSVGARYLDPILKVCIGRGLPWLTVIVVRRDTRRPGINWLPDDYQKDSHPHCPVAMLLWTKLKHEVFIYDWTERAAADQGGANGGRGVEKEEEARIGGTRQASAHSSTSSAGDPGSDGGRQPQGSSAGACPLAESPAPRVAPPSGSCRRPATRGRQEHRPAIGWS